MNITDFLSARARETPDAPAVLTAEGSLSCLELDRAVSWTAGAFRREGLAPGDMVAVQLAGQARHLIASLALARLGAGQIALFASDPAPLRRDLARRLGVVATVAEAAARTETGTARLDPPPGEIGDIKTLEPVETEAAGDRALPFLVLPTSGTTAGVPKLGVLTHATAKARLKHLVLDGPGTRFLSTVDLSFTGSLQNAYRCLIAGGCLALREGMSAEALVEFVAEHRVNYIYGTPNHAVVLLERAREGAILFPGVEAFQVGTTVVPEDLRDAIRERLTPNLYIHFGTTEAGTIAVASPALVERVPDVVGTAVPGVRAEVVDDGGEPLPPGDTGALRVRTPGMIAGYVDAPGETAEAFRDGWFHTGDLAEFTPDGALIHRGRADDLMILDGINIYPAEIESALLQHPAVAEAAAFPIPSPTHGAIPAAAVVVRSPVSRKALLSHCEHLIGLRGPRGLIIVSGMPRNAAGKVLTGRLAAMFRLE